MASGLVVIGSETTPGRCGMLSRSVRAAVALAKQRIHYGFEAVTLRLDEAASRYALAAGATRSRQMSLRELIGGDSDVTLLAGDLGGNSDLLAAQLAEAWSASLFFDVLDFTRDGENWQIVRDGGRGAREVTKVPGRIVLVISTESPARLYVSHHRRKQVRVEQMQSNSEADEKRLQRSWERAQPRARTGHLSAKNEAAANDRMLDAFGISECPASAGTGAAQIIQADPRSCAEHLLRFLAHHGFIERHRVSDRVMAGHGMESARSGVSLDIALGEKTETRDPSAISVRVGRGPRSRDEGPQRLARRPRPKQMAEVEQPDVSPRVARRPRSLRGTASLRGPRPRA